MENDRYNEKVKIFLNNGYKYEGYILADENGFLTLKDMYNKELRISKSAISVIEPLGVRR